MKRRKKEVISQQKFKKEKKNQNKEKLFISMIHDTLVINFNGMPH